MTDTIHAGDFAEYTGPLKRLADLKCEVGSRTPTGKRVRVTMRLADGRVVARLIKPENLKRLGGGVLENQRQRDEG